MLQYIIYKILFFRKDQIKKLKIGKYNCPCCNYKTLFEQGDYEICPVCYWEDETLEKDKVSGANSMTLQQSRENFKGFGACDKKMLKHVLPSKLVKKYGRK